ncbi:hypothetical protein [Mucilaginibacter sp.]
MKRIFLTLSLISLIALSSFGQTTTLTEDVNGNLNTAKVVAATSAGQIFFTGHQIGSGYYFPVGGIFRAITDSPNGPGNYYYDGVTNGTLNFSVRADGQGYFAGNVGIGTASPVAQSIN